MSGHPLRSYLGLRRTQAIFGGFLATSLLLVAFSGIDMAVSRQFFDHGFYMTGWQWTRLLRAGLPWLIVASLVAVAAICVFNQVSNRHFYRIDAKKLFYLLLVLTLGAGLIVNGVFKAEFGRARPRDVAEFGGTMQFSRPFVVSSNCSSNCSFSSGDAAGAFYFLAFPVAFGRRRSLAAAACAFGILVSAARIASGAHFLSDTVVSFFVMLITADALHYRMFIFAPQSAKFGFADHTVPERTLALAGAAESPAAQG